ncbi:MULTISPECIES: hypothetical protein [Levilactobacillus]|jgi:type II secretory pathway predicted ATPase ExeA|uniref:Uncharacterized protein n=1 Tax=Levilactobacillus angrenensis TaxID=2486020 RepID=A0ABW1U7K4_9LACO|nr:MULTISPECIES: hypothetical protein [Levilactobacillus]MCH4123201.1 hypothetical protein [Levilactobacillus sp.]MCI1552661.1 hypothetical protein [Levilactobacillus sp.]MCI1599633.1 hypothetical protein [Levilactobacillus sp.]MCI1606374.1 hypothetical protein [Levilactobacillus sp.]
MTFPEDIFEAAAYEWLKQQDLTQHTPKEVTNALTEAIRQAKGLAPATEDPWQAKP